MTYSVEPTRVSRGSKAPLVVLLGVAAALVGFATLTDHPAAPPSAPAAVAAPAGSPPPANVAARVPAPTPAHPGLGHGDDGLLEPPPAPAGTRWTPPRPSGVTVSTDIVRCHGIGRADCLRIANTAAGVIVAAGDPVEAIRRVEVWPSLLCNDSLVCPAPLLRRIVPLGSAVLSIDGASADAWVNVGADRVPAFPSPADATPPADGASLPLEAWIVR